MVQVLLSIGLILLILVISEKLWRTKHFRGERARKFIHIAAGVFIAFWPFFMSFGTIQLLSIAMLMVVLASRQFNIFKGIHGVRRHSIGDVLFPVSIGLVASITTSEWVFAAAILHLGLADGLAAVVGDRAAKKNRYKVFGETKSFNGSLTFWILSVLIISLVVAVSPNSASSYGLALILLLPVMATFFENVSVRGADNLTVPILVAVLLNQFVQMGLLY